MERGSVVTNPHAVVSPPQSMVVVNLVIHLADVLNYQLRVERRKAATSAHHATTLYDLALSTALLVFIAYRMIDVIGSEQTTQDTTGKLAAIDWDLPDLTPLVLRPSSVLCRGQEGVKRGARGGQEGVSPGRGSHSWLLLCLCCQEKKDNALRYTQDILDLVNYENDCNTVWM
eukprot:1992292-Pyramimonas_sp.AAC.1